MNVNTTPPPSRLIPAEVKDADKLLDRMATLQDRRSRWLMRDELCQMQRQLKQVIENSSVFGRDAGLVSAAAKDRLHALEVLHKDAMKYQADFKKGEKEQQSKFKRIVDIILE